MVAANTATINLSNAFVFILFVFNETDRKGILRSRVKLVNELIISVCDCFRSLKDHTFLYLFLAFFLCLPFF